MFRASDVRRKRFHAKPATAETAGWLIRLL